MRLGREDFNNLLYRLFLERGKPNAISVGHLVHVSHTWRSAETNDKELIKRIWKIGVGSMRFALDQNRLVRKFQPLNADKPVETLCGRQRINLDGGSAEAQIG
ncbi:MAG: hypothetical protein EBX68_07605, partial [Betaproteobacteria bacterium]|nr:hypothetical protein [Betaproteobacteria bacterium]